MAVPTIITAYPTVTKEYENLKLAIKKSNYEECARLITVRTLYPNIISEDPEKIFILVILSGNLQLLQLFIDCGYDVNLEFKNNNTSALCIAITTHNYDVCSLLIKQGANVNFIVPVSGSLLHIAASNRLYKICVLLVENGADVLCEDFFKKRPSFYSGNNTLIYQFLIQKEEEREMLNTCFKRAHFDDVDDTDYDDVDEEDVDEEPEEVVDEES